MKILSVHKIQLPDNVNETPIPDGIVKFREKMYEAQMSLEGAAELRAMIAEAQAVQDKE